MFGDTYRNPGKTSSGLLHESTCSVICGACLYIGDTPVSLFFGPPAKTVQKIEIPVTWGVHDFVELQITVSYKLHQPQGLFSLRPMAYIGKGSFSFAQKWRLYYPEEGLHLHPLAPTNAAPETEAKDISVEASMTTDVSPLFDQKNPFVSATINLAGGLSDDGIGVGYMGVDGTIGARKESFRIGNGLRLQANLKLEGRPGEIAPKPPVDSKIPADLMKHTIHFEKEDQELASHTELTRLEDKWYDPLLRRSKKIHDAIAAGTCPIQLEGFTSTTASDEHNKKLSQKRIDGIESAIRNLFPTSSKIKFVPTPHGKNLAKTSGPAAQERRVVLSISEK